MAGKNPIALRFEMRIEDALEGIHEVGRDDFTAFAAGKTGIINEANAGLYFEGVSESIRGNVRHSLGKARNWVIGAIQIGIFQQTFVNVRDLPGGLDIDGVNGVESLEIAADTAERIPLVRRIGCKNRATGNRCRDNRSCAKEGEQSRRGHHAAWGTVTGSWALSWVAKLRVPAGTEPTGPGRRLTVLSSRCWA